jgi:uncharacterized protein YraI
VRIISQETGKCAVAPVLDRGPLFVRDDWWNLQRDRVYRFKRGLPAAEVAVTGRDLGYGAGMSDAGHDVAGEFTYAAAIDLGAGTFVDLGLDPDEGIGEVSVKLLWQAGVDHLDACSAAYGNGQTIDDVNLRDGPSTDDDSITYLPANRRLSITGAMQNGFYLVDVDGMRGWVYRDYLRPDGGDAGDPVGFITDAVNLRAGPSTADDVHQVVPIGSVVVLTGSERNNFLSVSFDGTDGWISNSYVDLGDATSDDGDDDDDGSGGETAETTDYVNFRSGPGLNRSVIRVLPPGTVVLLNGAEENGFFSVTLDDEGGWISGDYLMAADDDGSSGGDDDGGGSDSAETTDYVNFRTGPALSRSVIRVLPPGTAVQLRGSEENGFFPVTHDGDDGWVHGDYLMGSDDDGGGAQTSMVVLDDLNLRDGPSTADGVILVMPPGAVVTVTGAIDNGFYPVSYRGEEGWAHYKYLQ